MTPPAQVKPADGTYALSGATHRDPNHTFLAAGVAGHLDPGTEGEIVFEWDPALERYVSADGDTLLWFFATEPPKYLMVNLATLAVERGTWN